MTDTFVAAAPDCAGAVPRSPYRLTLTPEVASRLGRYVSALVAKTRAAFEQRRATRGAAGPDRLLIDLSDVVTVPGAPLVLLLNLLRQALGDDVTITVAGARPAVTGALAADLPDDVVLIDARGRRWTR